MFMGDVYKEYLTNRSILFLFPNAMPFMEQESINGRNEMRL